jgi:hypothetical protein
MYSVRRRQRAQQAVDVKSLHANTRELTLEKVS